MHKISFYSCLSSVLSQKNAKFELCAIQLEFIRDKVENVATQRSFETHTHTLKQLEKNSFEFLMRFFLELMRSYSETCLENGTQTQNKRSSKIIMSEFF